MTERSQLRAGRPAPAYTTGPVTTWIRRASTVVTVTGVAATLVAFPFLPDAVPIHFGITGEPDAWGPRSTLFLPLVIWVAMHASLRWLSRKPEIFNYPVPVTEHNAQRLYREGERMVVWTDAACVLLLGGGVAMVAGLPVGALMPIGLLMLFVVLAVGTMRMVRTTG